MAISLDDLHAIAARARAQAAEAGELNPTGPAQVELPTQVRDAIEQALLNGAYERAAREATAGDADMSLH